MNWAKHHTRYVIYNPKQDKFLGEAFTEGDYMWVDSDNPDIITYTGEECTSIGEKRSDRASIGKKHSDDVKYLNAFIWFPSTLMAIPVINIKNMEIDFTVGFEI